MKGLAASSCLEMYLLIFSKSIVRSTVSKQMIHSLQMLQDVDFVSATFNIFQLVFGCAGPDWETFSGQESVM